MMNSQSRSGDLGNNDLEKEFEYESFVAEIQEVQSTLLAATTDLTNPLGDLVRAQIKRSLPPLYAATVLAVSKPHSGRQENGDLRRKRILLAAALEMLHIALNIHRLLVSAALSTQPVAQQEGEQRAGNDDSLDRSFIGSTILAGDYCFSRAAQMAAQTDHPRVVATFSLALQTVSEELLREQFHPDNGSYDERRQLLQSGTQAATLLVDLSASETQEAITLSHELASQWADQDEKASEWQPLSNRNEKVPAPWLALYQWLNHRLTNGEAPPTPHRQYR